MPRVHGQLIRCKCTACGAVELRKGCTVGFKCSECRPAESLQYLAHNAVADAIRAGLLMPIGWHDCTECGARAEHYEHRDYSKPLEVEPVCRRCNFRRGSAIGSPAARMAA